MLPASQRPPSPTSTTEPGGGNGPKKTPEGEPADFETYFQKKCYPQVKEICTNYGPLSFVWFDTPGRMPKEWVAQLVELVRDAGLAVLIATHNLDLAARMDRTLHLEDGHIA